jgi:hypothetical protein
MLGTMRRSVPVFGSLAALAAMLFAQAAIAAAAWESAPSPCHEQTPTQNVCFQHCSNNDLSLDIPRIKIPEPVFAPAPVAQLSPVRFADPAPTYVGVLPAGPPPRILFQSFRS